MQFDFLTHKEIDGTFDKKIKRFSGKIYKALQIREEEKTCYFRFFEYVSALKSF